MNTDGIQHIIQLPEDPLGGAVGTCQYHVLFAGKTSNDDFPYVVFNEKVAGEIGRMLGLHCPEILLEPFNDKIYFFSHWQETTIKGTILPGGTSREIAGFFKGNPEYVHGMIVFDLFIANNDRRRDNIVLRSDGKLALIDQGNALLYYKRKDSVCGVERLEKLSSDLRIMFDKEHHYLKALTNVELVEQWIEKIKLIPDYFIASLINNLPEIENIDTIIREKTKEFLLNRRNYIFDHIMSNRDCFPNLKGGKNNA